MRALIIVLALVMAACGQAKPSRPPAPAAPPVIELAMTEYRYKPSVDQVPAGRVEFLLANKGEQNHQPTLVVLPEDTPPILEQLNSSTRREVGILVNNPGLSPGVTGAIAVDLKPGQRYAFVCYAKTSDNKDHSRLGMAWEFRAGSANAAPPRS